MQSCVACHRLFTGTENEPERYAEFCLDCLQKMNLFVGLLQRREVEEDQRKAS